MPKRPRRLVVALAAWVAGAALAQTPPQPPQNSALDATLFYQLLVGELELRQGQPGNAFQVILDAARRSKDEQVFRRAVEVALQARAGDQALAATKAWQQARPQSTEALRTQLQILAAMDRHAELAEPLRALLRLAPESERAALIAGVPRLLQRAADKPQAARQVDQLLAPYQRAPGTEVAALVASGRAWAAADDTAQALDRARRAHEFDKAAPGPVLLALDLMPRVPAAEALVRSHMSRSDVEPGVRMAYARTLMASQRLVESAAQLERVTRDRPDMPQPYLTLGALHLEMRHPEDAERSLQRYVELAQAAPATAADDDDDDADGSPAQGVVQAWLMLAQAAEQRGDFVAAEGWLSRIDDPRRALEVQTRRATLMARQGKVLEARETVRRAPEREPGDARAKLMAEASVLREVKRWSDAYEVLGGAVQRYPEDADLIYEQAMMAEKLDRMDDMERLLRQVIGLKPDNAHAHNALGYSLADRGLRLTEARDLIRRALELSPGDPFITDSLGWVEYRLGNLAEAVRLLRQAYSARPDVEIGAHLGEVLWASGQHDEARRIWAESRRRDAGNEVLRDTLARLKVDL